MRRVLPLLLVMTAAALAAPAGALADGTVTLNGNELVYDSQALTSSDLFVTRQTAAFECRASGSLVGAVPCIQFADGQDVIDGVAGAGCVQVIDVVTACDPAVFTTIRLKLDDGDDRVFVGSSVKPTTIEGGEDDDRIRSSNGSDTLLGGPGDDLLNDDEDGNVFGNDLIDGGAGDDTIVLGRGSDNVIGGAGADSVQMDTGDDTVRLDDLANDGRTGETKNIHTDLETVDGSLGGDTLFGNAGANILLGNDGNDVIDGGGGNDRLDGGDGPDDLIGGAGTDRVTYSNTAAQRITLDGVRDDGAPGELDNVRADVEDVSAGAGNDEVIGNGADNVLDGGAGNDRLVGGAGADSFLGGAGADTVFARDGLAESVDCGTEADSGEADTNDLLLGCEGLALSSDLIPDADGDGVVKPADCDDGNPAVKPGVVDVLDNGVDEDCSGADAVNLDRDADGFLRPTDCDDANRLINPGARDIPGNRVDEDCKGGPAPFPLLGSIATGIFDFPGSFTRMVSITIRQPRKGSTLQITCRGGGCPFRTRTRKITRSSTKQVINRPLGGAKLRKGTKLELRLTKKNTVGFFVRFTMKQGAFPGKQELCIAPGKKRPTRCR